MDDVKLLKRADTKFIFNCNSLCDILEEITPNYRILETQTGRVNRYRTLYFDTLDFSCYTSHHNGKLNRTKIRSREYIDSKIAFMEVKFKSNKGQTNKTRIPIPVIETTLSTISKTFIDSNSFYKSEDLRPAIWNNFSRLTFVHKEKKERLTIDYNIEFRKIDNEDSIKISHLIIAEVKQEKASIDSDFISVMKKKHIRQSSMSKYCIGTVLTNKTIKSNNFKEYINKINKLKNVRSVVA